jgi:hypothetical protein
MMPGPDTIILPNIAIDEINNDRHLLRDPPSRFGAVAPDPLAAHTNHAFVQGLVTPRCIFSALPLCRIVLVHLARAWSAGAARAQKRWTK